jgi:hypothetical protein
MFFYYDIMVCFICELFEMTSSKISLYSKSSKFIDYICKDEKVTLLEVSNAIIYPPRVAAHTFGCFGWRC